MFEYFKYSFSETGVNIFFFYRFLHLLTCVYIIWATSPHTSLPGCEHFNTEKFLPIFLWPWACHSVLSVTMRQACMGEGLFPLGWEYGYKQPLWLTEDESEVSYGQLLHFPPPSSGAVHGLWFKFIVIILAYAYPRNYFCFLPRRENSDIGFNIENTSDYLCSYVPN
jgi:hypothetical protein